MRIPSLAGRSSVMIRTCLAMALVLFASAQSHAQGTKTLHRLQLVHPGAPASGITLQPPALVPTYTLNLPATAPTNGQTLTSNGTNGLSWGTAGAAFSGITSTTASNTIDNGNNALTWSWSGTTTNTGVLGVSTSLVNKAIARATTLQLSLTGANTTASQTTTTLVATNTRTGTGSTNYAIKINGSETLGGGNTSEDQPALYVVNGLTGFGSTAPTAIVQIGAGTSTANAGAPLKLHNGRANVSLDTYTATNDYKAGEMTYWDTVFVSSVANDMIGTMPSTMYRCTNDSATSVDHASSTWYNLFRNGTPPTVTSVNPTVTLRKGTYEFEIMFLMTTDWKFGFGFLEGPGSTVEYSWMATGWQGARSTGATANVVTFNTVATNTEIIPQGGSQFTQVFIRGILRVTSTTADITPQIYINTSSNGDIVYRNNYMKISCLGADNVKRRGKWE